MGFGEISYLCCVWAVSDWSWMYHCWCSALLVEVGGLTWNLEVRLSPDKYLLEKVRRNLL